MTYQSEFSDKNSTDYLVRITTEKGDETQSFKLGGSPFVIKYKSDGKHIYSPLKTSAATVTMLTDSYHFDLYSGKAQGTKVELINPHLNKVIWTGYATPCVYDMGFDDYLEEIEIEAVDGIAVLKDLPYRMSGSTVDTFGNIIFNCLKRSNCFKTLYITDNVQLYPEGNESIIEKFRISQQNFFDNKKDNRQTDDDVAWSTYDVLREIMQWLGCTMFADGDVVYIIDYDAIKAGNNRYFSYDLKGNTLPSPTVVNRQFTYNISDISYSENGTKLSLDDVFNKVSVKDSFKTFDVILGELGDDAHEQNITKFDTLTIEGDGGMQEFQNTNNIDTGDASFRYYPCDIFYETSVNGTVNNYQIWIEKVWNNRVMVCVAKFYNSDLMKFYKYTDNGSTLIDDSDAYANSMCLSKVLRNEGASSMRFWKREIDEMKFFEWWYSQTIDNWDGVYRDVMGNVSVPQLSLNKLQAWRFKTTEQRKAGWKKLLCAEIEQIKLEPILTMVNGATSHRISYDNVENYPYLKLSNAHQNAVFGGTDTYLIIKGNILYHDNTYSPFPLTNGADTKDAEYADAYKFVDECYLPARLRWGGKYWNGDEWTDTISTFKMYWKDPKNDAKNQYNTDILDKFSPFVDDLHNIYGDGEKGCYIPIPADENLNGEIEFTIFANRDMDGKWIRKGANNNRSGRNMYLSNVLVIKDLKIEAKISNGILNDRENNSDTVYTNVISNGSVNKMSEITFKVCTYDNKKPNYSSVDSLVEGKSQFVNQTVNKALKSNELVECGKQSMTQEEHMVYKLVKQYESPKVILTVNLNGGHKLYGKYTDKTLTNRTFIVNEMTIDIKNYQNQLKLIEKA